MTLGPLWWWFAGWVPIAAVTVFLVAEWDLSGAAQRWLGAVLGIVCIGYIGYISTVALVFVRRFREYKRELAERGLQHVVPVPPSVD